MSTVSGPLLPDVGLIALVPDEWQGKWQLRHQILTRLARYFHVVWMNPAMGWRESFARSRSNSVNTNEIKPPGFLVYTPEFWLPKIHRPSALAKLSSRLRLRRARKLLLRRGCRIIILYLWRPDFADALDSASFHLTCYHIDDEYTFSPVDLPVPEKELQLIRSVNQVFVHSRSLLEKKGKINPHTTLVPNGVDYDGYSKPLDEPQDLRRIPHPRIGYSGYVKKQLDWPLLTELAATHPEWSFVFVGEQSLSPEMVAPVQELLQRPNVYFLGSKTTQELTAYPQHFDVCVMPYRVDDYTKYISPLKLHEYLATGRPTVGTRIPSIEEYADVVAVPLLFHEWVAAIAAALTPEQNTDEWRNRRQAVARQYDWTLLVRKVATTMTEQLSQDYSTRLQAAVESEIKGGDASIR